eukprot:jgi/Chrzof1/4543/Cz14g17190.t1
MFGTYQNCFILERTPAPMTVLVASGRSTDERRPSYCLLSGSTLSPVPACLASKDAITADVLSYSSADAMNIQLSVTLP